MNNYNANTNTSNKLIRVTKLKLLIIQFCVILHRLRFNPCVFLIVQRFSVECKSREPRCDQ
jgi:hypothetical protein